MYTWHDLPTAESRMCMLKWSI